MESAEIRVLLEKYWEAGTTLEEEERLGAYFRQPYIDPDLEPVRELFAWRDEEAGYKPAADFEQRLLLRIPEMEIGRSPHRIGNRTPGKLGFPVRMAAAAAVILCLGIGLLIAVTQPRAVGPEGVVAVAPPVESRAAPVKDTYTDPREALAAVRNALLMASVRINEGAHITRKNMTRLHKNWEVATGD